VAGPVQLATPTGVERIDVRSASEMHDVVMGLADASDVYIGVAAVADYAPARKAEHKIKKGADRLALELERTPDILASVAALENGPFTVGFAAETDNLEVYAREKLSDKRLDMIAANRVGREGGGFESEFNEIMLLFPGGELDLGSGSKRELANRLIMAVADRLKDVKSSETRPDKDTRPAPGD
jgi:phosphopantothenoylcysteine decarboxylase/phosphopantothenate--cysteine ligase